MPDTHTMPESQLSPVGRIDKILLATDGSHYSAGAERVAIDMCAKGGAELMVMTAVIGKGDTAGWLGPQADKSVEDELAQHLEEIKSLAEEKGVSCTTMIESGSDPYEVIVETSKKTVADMIVMGRRGRRGLARLMLGDATAKVIGYAPCSVLVVPEESAMWENILLATDGSRFSDAAAVTTASLGKCCKAPVTVLSVRVPFHSERRQAEAQPIVDRVLDYMKEQGVDAQGMVAEGNADQTILEVAENRSSDLIVLGSFGRTGLGQMLFGSKAERVINNAKCPILIARGA